MNERFGYKASLEKATFFNIPEAGFLRISGNDRVDFLQRQSTNDVASLTSNSAIMTVLTSPKARIQDVFWLIDAGESIDVITLPQRSNTTFDFLRSRIFFNDNVSISDHSHDYSQIILDGPQAATGLAAINIMPINPSGVKRVSFDDAQITVFGKTGFSESAYHLILPTSITERVIEKFTEAGLVSLDADTYEVLRVEAGLPGEANEFTDDYTPLEVGLLEPAISRTKGCYTGQEVIARQVNFDKITRSLVGLRLDAPVLVGDTVSVEDKSAGKVTSVAHSPRLGDIALSVLKRPFNQVGSKVSIGDTLAEVSELPF